MHYAQAGYTVTPNYVTETYQSWEQTGTREETYLEWVPGRWETEQRWVSDRYEWVWHPGYWERVWKIKWFGFIPYLWYDWVWRPGYWERKWIPGYWESYSEWISGYYETRTRTIDVYGWVTRTRQVLTGYTAKKEVPVYSRVTRTRKVLTGYTASKTKRELTGYTATKYGWVRDGSLESPSESTEDEIVNNGKTKLAYSEKTLRGELVGYDVPVYETRWSSDEVEATVRLEGKGIVKLEAQAPAGIEATISQAGASLAGGLSEVKLRARVNSDGPLGAVKNSIVVTAKDREGRVKASGTFMLYAFEDSDVGRVVLDKSKPYRTVTKGKDTVFFTDAYSAGYREDGAVFARTASGGLGSGWASVSQWELFTARESGPITVGATMQVKSFVVAKAVIAGVSHGETAGHVSFNDEYERRTFEGEWGFDIPLPTPDKLRHVKTLYDIVTTTITTVERINKIVKALEFLGAPLETRTVRHTWQIQSEQVRLTHWVGAGVAVNHESFLIGGGIAVVVGHVDSIKVWRGTAPVLELKFNEGSGSTAYDRSGLGFHGSISGASWTSGLTSGALSCDSVNATIKREFFSGGESFEFWVKPFVRGGSQLLSFATLQVSPELGAEVRFGTTDGYFCFLPACGFCSYDTKTGRRNPGIYAGPYKFGGEWYHLVVTSAITGFGVRATHRMYVNGEFVGSTEGQYDSVVFLATSGPSCETLKIGARACVIEEARVYGRALSEDEIRGRYRAGPFS